MSDSILFCDNHLLIANKESGLLTQADKSGEASLETLAKEWVKEKYGKPGDVFLHAVHRLDRPTSGIVLFARTSKALARLNAAFREQKMEKVYLAVVEGTLKEPAGILEHWHLHGAHKALVSLEEVQGSKRAILHYRLLKSNDGFSLLEIRLKTGRYHQIRAQLSAIGHPIVGDQKYGSFRSLDLGNIALHHTHFSFFHPTSLTKLSFEAAPPPFWPFTLLN